MFLQTYKKIIYPAMQKCKKKEFSSKLVYIIQKSINFA